MTDPELFNVVIWFPDCTYQYVKRYVPAEEAVALARDYIGRPAATVGWIWRVMITDCGDDCNFLWEHGKGIVFPSRDELQLSNSNGN